MSGGHFGYRQHIITEIADEIERLIKQNDAPDVFGHVNGYSEETVKEFRNAVKCLRQAHVYALRIDWLVSDDDGEDTFHERLTRDLLEATE
jgi:hypothetical protein